MCYTQKCVLCGLLLLCTACTSRQTENRLAETERTSTELHNSVQEIEQKIHSMEGRLEAVATDVHTLATRSYEVKTRSGNKTGYVVKPLPLPVARALPTAGKLTVDNGAPAYSAVQPAMVNPADVARAEAAKKQTGGQGASATATPGLPPPHMPTTATLGLPPSGAPAGPASPAAPAAMSAPASAPASGLNGAALAQVPNLNGPAQARASAPQVRAAASATPARSAASAPQARAAASAFPATSATPPLSGTAPSQNAGASTPRAQGPNPQGETAFVPFVDSAQPASSLALPPETATLPGAKGGAPAASQGLRAAVTPPPASSASAASAGASLALPATGALNPGGSQAASPRPAPAAAPVTLAPLAPKIKGEEGAYNAALALARGGRSKEAIAQFQAFLQHYPSGRYAPNAQYWIGECLYAQKQYPDALLQFKDVAARYPRHHKSADALLKAGMSYTRLGDKENAALQYKALLTDFPKSEAARMVKGRGLAR